MDPDAEADPSWEPEIIAEFYALKKEILTLRAEEAERKKAREPPARVANVRLAAARVPSTRAPSERVPSVRAPSTRAPSTRAPSTRVPAVRAPPAGALKGSLASLKENNRQLREQYWSELYEVTAADAAADASPPTRTAPRPGARSTAARKPAEMSRAEAESLACEWYEAKRARDYHAADEIRSRLRAVGYEATDLYEEIVRRAALATCAHALPPAHTPHTHTRTNAFPELSALALRTLHAPS